MTLEEIKEVVYKVTGRMVDKDTRQWHYSYARKMFCNLASIHTTYTLREIGEACGITHASVLYAINTFDNTVMKVDKQREMYEECRLALDLGEDGVNILRNENRQLRRELDHLKMTKRESLGKDTERLISIFNSLPERLREDVKFKIETAYKINEKHKRDLNVIYTEG